MRVLNLRAHVGIQKGAEVLSSIDSVKHKVEMFKADDGVYVLDGLKRYFIPHGMINCLELDPKSFESAAKKPKGK